MDRVDGISHIFLHLSLCKAALQAPPSEAPVAVHVLMRYQQGEPFLDQTFKAARQFNGDVQVEFDVSQGIEYLAVEVPQFKCTGRDIVTILPDQNRKLNESLADGPDSRPLPDFLFSGTAPLAFLYTTKPTLVALDKTVTCDTPVQAPLPLKINAAYDQGAFYLSMQPDPNVAQEQPVFALRLATPTGTAHYIHVPIPAPAGGGWPETVHMNVTEDMVDEVITEKTETLLCPKLWRTSVR